MLWKSLKNHYYTKFKSRCISNERYRHLEQGILKQSRQAIVASVPFMGALSFWSLKNISRGTLSYLIYFLEKAAVGCLSLGLFDLYAHPRHFYSRVKNER